MGLEFNWREARFGNTFDAHRLIHLAASEGLADRAHERLMRAYFTEAVAIGDLAKLQRLGEEIGLSPDSVAGLLGGETFAAEVRADEELARSLGINAVPFFVFNQKYGVSGAQPVDTFVQVLEQVAAAPPD